MKTVIRLILSVPLLYGVYTETGVWTTLALGLVIGAIELLSFTIKKYLASN